MFRRGSQGIWALGFQAAFALLQTICSLPGAEAGFSSDSAPTFNIRDAAPRAVADGGPSNALEGVLSNVEHLSLAVAGWS